MNTTDPNDGDGWADLAKELGLETGDARPAVRPATDSPERPAGRDVRAGAAARHEPEAPAAEEIEDVPFDAEVETEDAADDEGEETDGDEGAEGTGEPGDAAEPGEPGDGGPKKKRRRRRRRKKKPGEAGSEGGPVAAEPRAVAPAAAASPRFDDEEPAEVAESDDGWADDADAEEVGAVVGEEQVTPEAAREIVANWNVPSWEEIVAGLHRPDR